MNDNKQKKTGKREYFESDFKSLFSKLQEQAVPELSLNNLGESTSDGNSNNMTLTELLNANNSNSKPIESMDEFLDNDEFLVQAEGDFFMKKKLKEIQDSKDKATIKIDMNSLNDIINNDSLFKDTAESMRDKAKVIIEKGEILDKVIQKRKDEPERNYDDPYSIFKEGEMYTIPKPEYNKNPKGVPYRENKIKLSYKDINNANYYDLVEMFDADPKKKYDEFVSDFKERYIKKFKREPSNRVVSVAVSAIMKHREEVINNKRDELKRNMICAIAGTLRKERKTRWKKFAFDWDEKGVNVLENIVNAFLVNELVSRRTGIDARYLFAQSIYESGHFTSSLCTVLNFGGEHDCDKNGAYIVKTDWIPSPDSVGSGKLILKNGKPITRMIDGKIHYKREQKYAAFKTPEEAAFNKIRILNRTEMLNPETLEEFAQGLNDISYHTAPETYPEMLKGIMSGSVNGRYKEAFEILKNIYYGRDKTNYIPIYEDELNARRARKAKR